MNQGHIDVSVIIPVYNTEHYLEECLNSLLDQGNISFEVICVDDGSEDNSLSILEEMKPLFPSFQILHQENAGAGAARNNGLKYAKGRYLYFLDSDDYLEPRILEKAIGKADLSDADIVVFKVYRYDANTGSRTFAHWAFRTESIASDLFSPEDAADSLFDAFNSWPHNKLFRRSFIDAHSLRFQELHRTNDLLFVFSALVSAKRIVLLKEFGLNYRVGTGQNSQATNSSFPTDFIKADLAFRDYLEGKDLWTRYRKGYCNTVLKGLIYNLESQTDPESFISLYELLRKSGIERLGLLQIPASDYKSSENVEMLHRIRRVSAMEIIKKGWNATIVPCGTDESINEHNEDSEALIEQAVKAVKSSNSYRIGRAITFLPRKMKLLLK